MKLLITGGCGFLGSNLSQEALHRGFDLTVFDNLQRTGSAQNLQWLKKQGRLTFIHGDIRSSTDIDHVVRNLKPEVIFHLAGQVAMTTSLSNPRQDFEINALGSFNLLEAARMHAPHANIIYSSTNKVYGDLENLAYQETPKRYICPAFPLGFSTQLAFRPESPYGCSKGAADSYMTDYARMFGLNTTVLRHSSMYGGRQFASSDQGWVGWFCDQFYQIKTGKIPPKIEIHGNGKQVRDLLHAKDMVDLYFLLALRAGGRHDRVFNVGGGIDNSMSLLEMFDVLSKMTALSIEVIEKAPRLSDQKIFVADTTALHKQYQWTPKVSATVGLDLMMDWIREMNAE